MKILKNGVKLNIITLQQYSTNNDILKFEFEKPLNFDLKGSIVEIIYEVDKLDNIKNNNITIEETENTISITWLVKESITLTKGDKKAQIVIKNNDRVYLSNVFIIKVLESLNIDNEIVETHLSYLEYWEERITELAEKVEDFEGLDLTQYVTKIDMDTSLDNYFTKLEIQEQLANKIDNTTLDNYYTSNQVDERLSNKASIESVYIKDEVYNKTEVDDKLAEIGDVDVSNLVTKEELNLKANINDVYTKKETYTKTEIDNKIQGITKPTILGGKGIDVNDNTVSAKFDNKTIGLNSKGELEAKLSTGSNDEGNTNIRQYIIKDVKSGTLYTIEDEGLPINHKLIANVFAIQTSKENIKSITDFELNIDDISSNNGIKIQDNYSLNVKNCESEIINKSNFHKILGFKGGV